MKKLFLTATVFGFGALFAQQNVAQTDFIKTTTEGKVKVLENNKWTTKKVKIVTLKEQNVVFDEKDRYKLNQDRINTSPEVTKIVMTDNDYDNHYDQAYITSYELDKNIPLLTMENQLPKMETYEISTLDNTVDFTGETKLNENRDFIITVVDENNIKSEILLPNDIF